jgi:hypothetical protein
LDSAYTPQMVVDGNLEFVGNDDSALHRALGQAAQKPKTAEVSLAWQNDGALNVAVNNSASQSASVLLAITESALTTKVGGGENTGRELHHAAVVRRMTRLGSVKGSRFVSNAKVKIDTGWKPENLKAVVFVQDERTGAVLGAAQIAFSK